MALTQPSASLWPPAGIAMAGILLLGYRYSPCIALGSFLLSLLNGESFGLAMFAHALGNTLAALAGAYLLLRFKRFNRSLERLPNALAFLVLAAGVSVLIKVLGYMIGQVNAGPANQAGMLSLLVAVGLPNLLGVLVIAPAILVWSAPGSVRFTFRRGMEAGMCGAGLIVCSWIAFNPWLLPDWSSPWLPALPLFFLIWSALRFGTRGGATAMFLFVALFFCSLQAGWQAPPEDNGNVFEFNAQHLAIIAALNLLVAAAAGGCRRTFHEAAGNEKRFRRILADQTDLICRFQADGTLTYANPAFCEFHGRTEAELLGIDFFQTLIQDEARELRANLAKLPEERPVWTLDRRALAADDHVQWHQCHFRRLVGFDGKTGEYQAVIRNITQRKQAEIALQEAKTELEQMNLKLAMAANEARAAAAEANRANIAKSEFLANMSHEIRTPLSGILGMVELLAQTRLDVRQKEFAEAASENANALLHVISDVLDYSKIEAGKLTIAREEFNLRKIVDGVMENAAARSSGKKLNLAAVIQNQIPRRLMGDPIRIRQVLLNLVGNGIKFTEHGEVVVRVQTIQRSPDRIKLRFEVQDTGAGLNEEQLKKLFQPFMQADASSSRKYGGTGLGLAITHRIVELMGGRIGVRSAVGAGSTFWFELPLGVPAQPPLDRCYPGLVFAHILIAIPNASLREALTEQLRGWGIDCQAIPTVEELSRAIRHELNNYVLPLVLCDDDMLSLGGEKLRQQLVENQKHLQCILLANPAAALDKEDDLALFNCVLLKPAREQALFDGVVSVVSGKRADALRPVRTIGDTEMIRREPPASKRTPISHLRILAADDHPFNRRLCQLMLDGFGARADWVVNGREAVEKFQPGLYDAILMDCNMPELDGHDAAAAIRHIEVEHNSPRRVRIIALTANALIGERERCLAAGMDDYLTKPYTAQQLYQALLATAPAQPLHGGAFDPARIEQLIQEMDRNSVCEMVSDFLDELPERLTEVRRLYHGAHWPELKRAAHSLKGLFLLFGFQTLSEHFHGVEEAAGLADARRIGCILDELVAQTESAVSLLREWLVAQKLQTSD